MGRLPSSLDYPIINVHEDARRQIMEALCEGIGCGVPESVSDDEWGMCMEFVAMWERTAGTRIYVEGPEGILSLSCAGNSRYFVEGRRRIRKKILRRVDGCYRSGVLLTLTFRREVGRARAWEVVGGEVRRFLNVLNEARKRKYGSRVREYKRLGYLWVLEAHKDGFPHVHVFFPGLRWLWGHDALERMWGWGMVHVQGRVTIRGAAYICKYVTKMSGWDLVSLGYIWRFGRRLYGVSRGWYVGRADEGVSLYRLVGIGNEHGFWVWNGEFFVRAEGSEERIREAYSVYLEEECLS